MLNSTFRFQIIEEEFGTKTSYKLYDNESGEYVSVLPCMGGSINGMALSSGDKLVEIIDGYTSYKDAQDNLMTTFKGSNLIPFPNRIADGKYSFQDRNLQLPLNFPQEKNAIHGLLFNTEFKVIDKEDGEIGCKLIIEYTAEETEGYPYKYHQKISYSLLENHKFECKIKITNLMDHSIPVGHGWHPYFRLGESLVDNLLLKFPAEEVLDVNSRNIPTGKSKSYKEFNEFKPIQKTVLDNCFSLPTKDEQALISIMDHDGKMGYTIWQETGKYKYNFLQVYTPAHRKSIAIEPMTCAPDAFNNKNGLIILAPLESFSARWGVFKN